MWEPQRLLADTGWRVIVPQLRGFDSTTPLPTESCTMADYASDVRGLLDFLHVEKAVIGGLSMGGYVALALYRLAPERFSGLVLADTRADADASDVRANRQRLIALAHSSGASAIAGDMLPKLLGATSLVRQPALADQVRGLISVQQPSAIQAALGAMMERPDSTALLPTIAVPTLVVVGEEDVLTPPPLSESMATAIPHAQLERVAEAGHLSNMEQPVMFNFAVVRFLRERIG
jgi:pimeloyl-ACP methyl ester carboxylesterase